MKAVTVKQARLVIFCYVYQENPISYIMNIRNNVLKHAFLQTLAKVSFKSQNEFVARDISIFIKSLWSNFIFPLMSPFAPKHLYFSVNTHFHNPINTCCIIFIFRFIFLLIYQITKVKVGFEQHPMLTLRPSLISYQFYRSIASFWVFAWFTFHLFGCFSQRMSGVICALLNWHLLSWMEFTNRKLSQLHLPDTCARMRNLQSYFGLHE